MVAQEHVSLPLVNFSMTLPADWGMPLGWSIAFVPVVIIVFGFIFHLIWMSKGMPFRMVRFPNINFNSSFHSFISLTAFQEKLQDDGHLVRKRAPRADAAGQLAQRLSGSGLQKRLDQRLRQQEYHRSLKQQQICNKSLYFSARVLLL